jgi:hypothetical protein
VGADAAKKSRDAAYDRITGVLGALRKMGRLAWRMVLDLTRELDEWQVYGSPREARAALRSRYDEDRWLGQPYFPIFIVEKDTMEPVCRPMASRWQIPFASSRGYGSLKLQHDVAETLNRRHARAGQSAIVYFISDLDPSGLDLQRAWEEALASFDVRIHKFVRIGLTPEQDGDRCWETDILPASVIEQILTAHIRSWLDAKLRAQRDVEINRARTLL